MLLSFFFSKKKSTHEVVINGRIQNPATNDRSSPDIHTTVSNVVKDPIKIKSMDRY
jgi:hypothetical protein